MGTVLKIIGAISILYIGFNFSMAVFGIMLFSGKSLIDTLTMIFTGG